MKGAIPETPGLAKWLHHAQAAAVRLELEGPLDPRWPRHDQLSQLNVLVQIEHLTSYPLVRARVAAGTLQVRGMWFDIAKGDVYGYDRTRRQFAIIDREVAERLLARLREA